MKALDTAKTIERKIVKLMLERRKAQRQQPEYYGEIDRKYHFAINQMYQLALDLGLTISGTRIDRMITKDE